MSFPHKRTNAELISGFSLDTIEGTRLMYKANLLGQMLVLMYSAIDSMGLLAAPPSQISATGESFKSWVNKYLLPQDSNLEFIDVDLWAARCAVLHTYTTQSDLSRKATARQIQYYSGDKNSEFSKAFVTATRDIENGAHVPVHIEDTWMAFCNGIKAFAADLEDKCKTELAYEVRLRNVLQHHFVG